jgi:hypothetical protein
VFRFVEAVADEAEEARGVALHQVFPTRILGAERALFPDVAVEPFVVTSVKSATVAAGVELIAADAAPGGLVVGAARAGAGADDVEQVRETPVAATGPLSSWSEMV